MTLTSGEKLVERTLAHLAERYGRDEVATWPVEVWNEPNIGFWAGTMQEYFHLYEVSARAVKRVDPRIPVGGPAICGVDTEHWLRSFFSFVTENDLPIDMVTRHCYTANQPRREGYYVHHSLRKNDIMIDELRESRQIMDDYPRSRGCRCTSRNSALRMCRAARSTTPCTTPPTSRASSARRATTRTRTLTGPSVMCLKRRTSRFRYSTAVSDWSVSSRSKNRHSIPLRSSPARARAGVPGRKSHRHRDGDRYAIIGWHADATTDQSAEPISYNLRLPGCPRRMPAAQAECGRQACESAADLGQSGQTVHARRCTAPDSAGLGRAVAAGRKLFAREDGWLEVSVSLPSNHLCMLEITPVEDRTATYAGFDAREHYGLE